MRRPVFMPITMALYVATVCALTVVPAAASDAQSPAQLARKQIDAGAARDWPTLRTLYAADVHYVDPNGESRGVDAAINALERTLKPFGEVKVTIAKVYEGKDFAVAEWSTTAINSAEMMLADGSQAGPTGNEVKLDIVTIYDIKDGKIVSERNYYDALNLYGSLGLLGD